MEPKTVLDTDILSTLMRRTPVVLNRARNYLAYHPELTLFFDQEFPKCITFSPFPYIDLKKSARSLPCVRALTSLSILIIFPSLSMMTVIRFLDPSGLSVAPKSKLKLRPVSTRSGKFRLFSSANFWCDSAS